MKLKKYKLRFIKDSVSEIKIGMNIGRHNLIPINKYDFGYVEDIKDDSLGFSYGIREMDSNKLYYHHISTIQPILPVLISDEDIQKGDRFYVNTGELHTCIKRGYDNDMMVERIFGDNGINYLTGRVQKVVAGPSEIGWIYNEGPPHDHNRNWKYDDLDKKHLYVEDYLPSAIHSCVKDGCKVTVIVEEICPHYNGKHIGKDCSCRGGFIMAPKIYEGKIIMDSYGLCKKSPSGDFWY